jgi:hypothetical protein
MYAYIFTYLHIFTYLDSKFGSIDIFYGSKYFHRLLLIPKWTSYQGVMPSGSKRVPKFHLNYLSITFSHEFCFAPEVARWIALFNLFYLSCIYKVYTLVPWVFIAQKHHLGPQNRPTSLLPSKTVKFHRKIGCCIVITSFKSKSSISNQVKFVPLIC